MMPIASFIVPVYNEEKHIRKCIDSLLAQTVPDFEEIIVDDGSTDNTPAILKNYKDSRIRVYRQNNLGRAEARNRAFYLSKGKYIALQDADDWSEPDRLERQLYLAEQSTKKPVVGSGYIFHYSGNTKAKIKNVPKNNNEIRRIMSRKIFRQAFHPPTMLSLRQKIIDIGGWRSKFEITGEDGDLISRLYEEKDVEFFNSDRPLYHYLHNEGSITNKYKVSTHQQMFMRYCERVRRRGMKEPENYRAYMDIMAKNIENRFLYKAEYLLRWFRISLRRY